MTDYIDERGREPCGKTVPDSIAAALAVRESIGEVEHDQCLSNDKCFKAHLDYWRGTLEKGAEPVCKAQCLPVAVLIALELWVVNEGVPLRCRALAWLLLIMRWGSVRAEDTCGINGARLSWSETGLKGILVRTKTTGPGRRGLEIAFFVSKEASLAGVPWLKVGFLI